MVSSADFDCTICWRGFPVSGQGLLTVPRDGVEFPRFMKVRVHCDADWKARVGAPSETRGSSGGGVGRPTRSGAFEDDFAVAGGWQARADAEQCVDSRSGVAAAGPQRPPATRLEYLRSFGLFGLWQLWQSSGPGGRVHFMIAEKSSDVKVKRVSRLAESKSR